MLVYGLTWDEDDLLTCRPPQAFIFWAEGSTQLEPMLYSSNILVPLSIMVMYPNLLSNDLNKV